LNDTYNRKDSQRREQQTVQELEFTAYPIYEGDGACDGMDPGQCRPDNTVKDLPKPHSKIRQQTAPPRKRKIDHSLG
jgi:hypothetical protein